MSLLQNVFSRTRIYSSGTLYRLTIEHNSATVVKISLLLSNSAATLQDKAETLVSFHVSNFSFRFSKDTAVFRGVFIVQKQEDPERKTEERLFSF